MANDMKFSGGGRERQGGDGQRQLYKAVCASCGKSCEVPFRPSGDRPVYCKDCFRARSEGGGLPAPQDASRQAGGAPRQGGAPSPSSSRSPMQMYAGGQKGGGSLAGELMAINGKLDRLLALLEGGASRVLKSAKPAKKTAPKKKSSARRK